MYVKEVHKFALKQVFGKMLSLPFLLCSLLEAFAKDMVRNANLL